jgi:hypothetical protein
MDVADDAIDTGDYCRQVERHLCQRNHGHLVRIVGPAFDLVCGWATRGIPLRVALHGIDRYVDRQTQKAPRRRPIRVEFAANAIGQIGQPGSEHLAPPVQRRQTCDGALEMGSKGR